MKLINSIKALLINWLKNLSICRQSIWLNYNMLKTKKIKKAKKNQNKKGDKNKKNASNKLGVREELLAEMRVSSVASESNTPKTSRKKQAAIFMSPIDGSSIIVSGNIPELIINQSNLESNATSNS